MRRFAIIVIVAGLTSPALAFDSYSLEQMQSDNNRVELERQRNEIFRLEDQQQQQQYRMDALRREQAEREHVEIYDYPTVRPTRPRRR
jgi:hypothetical protein